MNALTAWRRLTTSESGVLVLVGLLIALWLAALQLLNFGTGDGRILRAAVGVTGVGVLASYLVKGLWSAKVRRAWRQILLKCPLTAFLAVACWLQAAALLVVILRFGISDPDHRDLRTGFLLTGALAALGRQIANRHYDKRDAKEAGSTPTA